MAEDIGPHQLERLVELLTAHECEELISAISQPEESIFQHLDDYLQRGTSYCIQEDAETQVSVIDTRAPAFKYFKFSSNQLILIVYANEFQQCDVWSDHILQ